MARTEDFDKSVALPPGLTIAALKKSVEYIERELSNFVEIYMEQMNVFSAIVGIFGTLALDRHSVYEKVGTLTSPKPDFLICADVVRRPVRQNIAWNRKQANALGQSNHITIMKAGTLSGVTWSIRPRRLKRRSQLSSGELISFT
jgi:hypothetical protein